MGANRLAVIDWMRSVTDRPSVLGSYSFDPFGDTTLRTSGLYRIHRAALIYAGAVEAPQ